MTDSLIDKLRSVLIEISPGELTMEKVKQVNNLQELTLNSIDIITFVTRVEEIFEFNFDEADFDIQTIFDLHKLSDYIAKKQ